tara:strand:- start:4705 stop:5679 length:975 start_codon:yes stop_codon:yes gene_type:complete
LPIFGDSVGFIFFTMNASISPKLSFGAEAKTGPVAFSSGAISSAAPTLTNADFLRQSCASMRLGVGPRDHQECPHRVTFDYFSPHDSEGLTLVIEAAYRQVFGHCHVMDHERSSELEAQLKDGRLCVRDFVRGLAKSDFYKTRFFEGVSPQRGVELSFKHLLGRAPLDQQEATSSIVIQAQSGFDAMVDALIDSAEYAEVFGADTVPYVRAWTSASGMPMINFMRIAALEQSFASSDRSKGTDSILRNNLINASPLTIKVPPSFDYMSASASWSGGKPPVNYEKLWRGLALVGGLHLAGMFLNVTTQIAGIHTLDRIPAMFLGL